MISICSHFKTAVLSSVTRQRRARDYPCLFSHQERLCSISAEEERDEGKGESERRLGQKLKNGKLAAFESDIREETWDAKRKDAIGRTKSKGRLRRSLVLSTLGSDSAWQKHPKRLSSDKRDVRFWFRRYGRTEKKKKKPRTAGQEVKLFSGQHQQPHALLVFKWSSTLLQIIDYSTDSGTGEPPQNIESNSASRVHRLCKVSTFACGSAS